MRSEALRASSSSFESVRGGMKVFFACLAHETNNLSPIPTTLRNFEEMFLYRPSIRRDLTQRDAFYRMVDIPQLVRAAGHELAESVIAFAMPSGPLCRSDYESLRSEILADLERALPVDIVLLFMHGAQMARGCNDVEGDLLTRVRTLVGPDVPVGVELDLHANVTRQMIECCDIVSACKEYPHTDWHDEAGRLLRLLECTARREIRPAIAFAPVPMLQLFPTTQEPMRGLVNRVREMERSGEALSVTLIHGFPIADSKHTGAGVIVVTDDDAKGGRRLADSLAEAFFALRMAESSTVLSFDEAIDRALAHRDGTVVIGDSSDAEGGAAPGDSTFFLRRLLERDVTGAALAMMWDPQAVKFATDAGVGATLPLRIGGKVGPMSGEPLDVVGTVTAVSTQASQRGLGTTHSFGPAVALRVRGVDVVLASVRQQVFSPDCFTALGIEPQTRRMLVVKSRQHFHALFAPLAKEVIYSGRFKTLAERLRATPFRQMRRPIWPLDATPFEAFGRVWQ